FIPALQQVRWPTSRIADSASAARDRLFVLPGSHYEDPEFSWRWAVAPAAIGFGGSGLGPQHANDLFVGAARTFLDGGYLFEFKFDRSRQHFAFTDQRLRDKVDDNDYKFDEGESGSLVAGKNFGIMTNIVTGPDGNLYVTSLSNGAVYKISDPDPTPVPSLQHDFGFHFTGDFFQSYHGLGAKWFQDKTGAWFVLTSDGQLRPWQGGSSLGSAVATIDPSVWDNPDRLFGAMLSSAAQAQLGQLQDQFGFHFTGDFFQDYHHLNAK